MNDFEQIIDKKLVEEFEKTSIPINNISLLRTNSVFNIYMNVIQWYHNHEGLDANSSIYKKWKKISQLLEFQPIYQKTYSYKNSVWAFYWKKDKPYTDDVNATVLIYSDKRGIKIQVSPKFRKDEIVPLLTHLKEVLTTPIEE